MFGPCFGGGFLLCYSCTVISNRQMRITADHPDAHLYKVCDGNGNMLSHVVEADEEGGYVIQQMLKEDGSFLQYNGELALRKACIPSGVKLHKIKE